MPGGRLQAEWRSSGTLYTFGDVAENHAIVAPAQTNLDRPLLRTALWLLLGGWFGAYLLFGAVIAPTAFSVLPTSELAGNLVGPILTKLHLYGALAGFLLALIARALGRGKLLIAAPLGLSALCLYSHFGVSAELDEIRELAFGPGGNTYMAARFSFLHSVSVGIFIGVGVAVTFLIGLHARADSRSLRR